MAGRLLLDTAAIIDLFAQDRSIMKRLRQAEQVFVPSIVIGEMYYGAFKSAHAVDNIARVDEFASASAILAPTAATAREYGEIKNALRAKGRPIPENDIWVAAIAKQHDLTILTRDEHFREVQSVVAEAW
jgi:tRNA(fMet)-specific endonuclease VapC